MKLADLEWWFLMRVNGIFFYLVHIYPIYVAVGNYFIYGSLK